MSTNMSTNRAYTLNTELARQAGASLRIIQSGRYAGHFTRAEAIASRQQTEGIEFTFVTDDGRTADFLTCWTHAADGRELYGLKVLNAILTCMRLREIAPRNGKLRDRNGSIRDARLFPQLVDKPIGLVLQREEYLKQDGGVGFKFTIVAPFEVATGMTAGEILDQAAEPAQLARIVASVRDKPLARRDGGGGSQPSLAGALADMDEDIPF